MPAESAEVMAGSGTAARQCESPGLQDQTFDTVFHMDGIKAFDDQATAIRKMIRVTKGGTKVVIKVVIMDKTIKLMEALTWLPDIRHLLDVYRDRFSPLVVLVPTDTRNFRAKEIMGGELDYLPFEKP